MEVVELDGVSKRGKTATKKLPGPGQSPKFVVFFGVLFGFHRMLMGFNGILMGSNGMLNGF